jgi:hypothetical protein
LTEDWKKDMETKLMEMKEWERYLAKGGLLEQIIERVDKFEGSYINSMASITTSLKNLLRRTRKLENILQTILVKYSECEDSTIHKSFYLGLLKIFKLSKYCKYLSNDRRCLKGAPCDENYDFLSNCPAVIKAKNSEEIKLDEE